MTWHFILQIYGSVFQESQTVPPVPQRLKKMNQWRNRNSRSRKVILSNPHLFTEGFTIIEILLNVSSSMPYMQSQKLYIPSYHLYEVLCFVLHRGDSGYFIYNFWMNIKMVYILVPVAMSGTFSSKDQMY